MSKTYGVMVGLALIGTPAAVWAADNNIAIPQVSQKPADAIQNGGDLPLGSVEDNAQNGKDYQKEVLSDPEISDLGRANSLTNGGGNTAVIMQEGGSNSSSITQTGNDNYASQTQKGKANDIRVEQQGMHNRSQESQTGDYNHKVKIQNGRSEETTIEQAGKPRDQVPENQ